METSRPSHRLITCLQGLRSVTPHRNDHLNRTTDTHTRLSNGRYRDKSIHYVNSFISSWRVSFPALESCNVCVRALWRPWTHPTPLRRFMFICTSWHQTFCHIWLINWLIIRPCTIVNNHTSAEKVCTILGVCKSIFPPSSPRSHLWIKRSLWTSVLLYKINYGKLSCVLLCSVSIWWFTHAHFYCCSGHPRICIYIYFVWCSVDFHLHKC